MKTLLLAVIALYVFYLIYQIATTLHLSVIAKGEEKQENRRANKINGNLMIVFLILGLIGVYLCNEYMYPHTLLAFPSASKEGEVIDIMLYITIALTGVIFIITQVLLFYFAWKYQYKKERKSYYYPHNNKLELLWTTVPAIALTVLIGFGLRFWYQITIDAPEQAAIIEVTGKQFGWIFRYPGKDNQLGKRYYRHIDDAKLNPIGQMWDDIYNHDDIVFENEMHVVVGRPVQLLINSRDVIHDVGLSHFRLKMDAVPGMTTTLWFTPTYTTKEMKKITKNPNFSYEISCDQMCGSGHYSMKGIIVVETQEEFNEWINAKQSRYQMVKEQGMLPEEIEAKKTQLASVKSSTAL